MTLTILVVAVLSTTPLMEARKDFSTKLDGTRNEEPFESVKSGKAIKYPSGDAQLSATLMTPKSKAAKLPAIVWLTGGLPPGGMNDQLWTEHLLENDQSARQYFDNGFVMLFPTFRGSYGNAGKLDSFWGEVDDVLAAIEWLKKQPNIDTNRVWLGGHSSGATLAVLAAEAGAAVQGVIAFGATAEVCEYSKKDLHFETSDLKECELRSPAKWLKTVTTPMWLIAGALDDGISLSKLRAAGKDATNLHFVSITGASHFDVLQPINTLIAKRLAAGKVPLADDAEAQATFDKLPLETITSPDGWSLALPAGFEDQEPRNGEAVAWARYGLRVSVKQLEKGVMDQKNPCPPQSEKTTEFRAKWNKVEVCGAQIKSGKVRVIAMQLPLLPAPAIIVVTWTYGVDEEIEAFTRRLLAGIKGPTNWK